jgi:hypothetical protein
VKFKGTAKSRRKRKEHDTRTIENNKKNKFLHLTPSFSYYTHTLGIYLRCSFA